MNLLGARLAVSRVRLEFFDTKEKEPFRPALCNVEGLPVQDTNQSLQMH